MTKKYKLSKIDTSDSKPQCAFFATEEGCRNGTNCKFLHGEVVTTATTTPHRRTSQNEVIDISSPDRDDAVSSETSDSSESSSSSSSSSNNSSDDSSESGSSDDVVENETKEALREIPTPSRGVKERKGDRKDRMKRVRDQPIDNDNDDVGTTKKRRNDTARDSIPSPRVDAPTTTPPNPFEDKRFNSATITTPSPSSNKSRGIYASMAENPSFQTYRKALPPCALTIPQYQRTVSPARHRDSTEATQPRDVSSSDDDHAVGHPPPSRTDDGASKPTVTTPRQTHALLPNLDLPIAPFTPRTTTNDDDSAHPPSPNQPGGTETVPPAKTEILPLSTPSGRKWKDLILKTRNHPKYSTNFSFTKWKALEVSGTTDWITSKPHGSWCESFPHAIAIDCEMCDTKDPLTNQIDSKALCRISVLDADHPDQVLLDTLVKPLLPITNYKTDINGISKDDLDPVQFTLRHAQAFLSNLCCHETVLIGHGVNNDLMALKWEHDCIVDSSLVFTLEDEPLAAPSLKDCAKCVLGTELPNVHDSILDARTSLDCVNMYLIKRGDVGPIRRSMPLEIRGDDLTSLFVHRIPKGCSAKYLAWMFVEYTYVRTKNVDVVEFSDMVTNSKKEFGKTMVHFLTERHAALAFETLKGEATLDRSGRWQKKVRLKEKEKYLIVRTMERAKTTKSGNEEM